MLEPSSNLSWTLLRDKSDPMSHDDNVDDNMSFHTLILFYAPLSAEQKSAQMIEQLGWRVNDIEMVQRS